MKTNSAMNVFGVLVCVISAAIAVPDYFESVPNVTALNENFFRMRLLAPHSLPEQCDPEEMSCSDDKLTFCAYGVSKVTVPCSSLFDGKPGYCDCENVQCVPTRPQCLQPNNQKCHKVGKMPDPTNCTKFSYCDGNKRNMFACPKGLIYDAENQNCSVGIPCRTAACNPKKLLEFIPMPQSPKYYLFCYYGVGEMRECSQPGYSMQDGKCQYQCKKTGMFKDPKTENCKKGMWHSCIPYQNGFVRQTSFCGMDDSTQLYFDETVGLCLPADVCDNGSSTTETPQRSTP